MGRASNALLLVSLLALGLLCLLSVVEAIHNLDCCYTYTKKALPSKVIRRITLQSAAEVCDIDAVIFHTKRGFNVCANPQDAWVKKFLKSARGRKLKSMS
ncbi:C-C motif chemokine 20-like [Rhinatrema bivittatum]|uniref:C-C motif chemokine 20-like n=1 Tax=Rhinatrema bivittatum TaxID=194408 RepID=UPI0011295602|nr:C-C motif chemokine 20-like [Rhinatrema bivittatum]